MVRPLTEEELCAHHLPAARRAIGALAAPCTGTDAPRRARRKIFFEKLAKYIGRGIRNLIDRPDGAHCFRLHRDRVYYVREDQVPRRRLARACACRL